MNQPPGYPPGGPPYPGAPGAFPQQGQAPHGQPPQQPGHGAQGTQLMVNAPINVAQFEAQARAQATAAAAQQQQPYGQPPGGPPPGYGAPPGAPPAYGQPPAQAYGQPPPQAYGQPPAQGYGQAPPAYGQPPAPAYGQAPAPYGQAPGYPGAAGYGQPGAPAPQQGMQGPQIGIGGFGPGGIPRINFQGGDFSPTKIMNVILKGDGYESPRKMGALFIGAAMAFYVVNTVLIFALHLYYPYFYSLGAIIWWAGWWLLIFGQPRKTADGSPSAMWGRIGLAVCLAFGILSALGTAFSMRMAF